MQDKLFKGDLGTLASSLVKTALLNTNCHRIGKISSVDTSTMTAIVELVDKQIKNREINDTRIESFPPLLDCPIINGFNNTGGVKLPIQVGDYCLVLFNDRNINKWYQDGLTQLPENKRLHSINDAIVICNIFNNANPPSEYDNESTTLFYEDAKVICKNDKIGIKNSTTDLQTVLDDFVSDLNDILVNHFSRLSGLLATAPSGPVIFTNLALITTQSTTETNATLTAVQTKINSLLSDGN